MNSKSSLGIVLSRLAGFEEQSIELEQYQTPSELAADLLWFAYLQGDIKGRVILDAGCGPGIFGVGALLLGAKKVIFVDKDKKALALVQKNLAMHRLKGDVIEADIADITGVDQQVDSVLMNPPFGTKQKHHDKLFLEKATAFAPVIYTIHKSNTRSFIEAFCRDVHYTITNSWNADFPIKKVHEFHKKPKVVVEVRVYRFERAT